MVIISLIQGLLRKSHEINSLGALSITVGDTLLHNFKNISTQLIIFFIWYVDNNYKTIIDYIFPRIMTVENVSATVGMSATMGEMSATVGKMSVTVGEFPQQWGDSLQQWKNCPQQWGN